MDRAKLTHDCKVRGSNYRKDDLVLMHNHVIKPGTTKKLCNKWKGPYRVVDCLNDVNYKIKHVVKRVLQEELTQPDTNLINEYVKSPLNITARHGDLNRHPGENQNVT
ncbi:unnamed protein product [Brachionus calyciflorus]|uniref:Uncharacterized protein n=1 Tax=Brachionus calyciflorus TaxID=104777 RepID=A0A814NA68_9BILA|nr:unnamed protein product [Brachionus calyciflorus]